MKHPLRLILPIATLAVSLLVSTPVSAQDSPPGTYTASPTIFAAIAAATPPDRAIAPLMYLADDRLKGRYVLRPEIDTAALYIAGQFRQAGARPVPGADGYFQFFTHRFNANRKDSGQDIRLRNVLALIPGTDPQLRDQYVILSSHYDHLGVTNHPRMEEGKLDSIYNGARDNASGCTAVINAARYFDRHPAKRTMIFICFTAEEEGEIGSKWYAEHPLIPVNRTVYQLNIDNASYDDTALVTLVGLNRTSEDSAIIAACRVYGLRVNNDPTGGALFYQSDNAALAAHGIPAPTYSMGMLAFDSTITNRYHRLSDETGNMDMDYVLKWIRAYILAAQFIADEPDQPRWAPGDLYEKAWKALYPDQK
jgi:Zn-dependent M28 family amino/carboxypeptidase